MSIPNLIRNEFGFDFLNHFPILFAFNYAQFCAQISNGFPDQKLSAKKASCSSLGAHGKGAYGALDSTS